MGKSEQKRWALLSVTDKSDVGKFAQSLHELGYAVLSTGKTALEIQKTGVPVTQLSEFTHFPEIFDGRIKTLHPKVFGGILHRDLPEDLEICRKLQIDSIDIVAVNLYQFEKSVEQAPEDLERAIENIDIGGPSLIRAAAKNFKRTLVVTDPHDYDTIIEKLKRNENTENFRFQMAVKAFQVTSRYDAAISNYLSPRLTADKFPSELRIALKKTGELRYGENPHQEAALYTITTPKEEPPLIEQLQGKQLSFNNYLDMSGALALAHDLGRFQKPTAVIIKHTNPCGAALANSAAEAFRKALSTDPTSAFGGIVALNRPIDAALAKEIGETFFEIILAPAIENDARGIFEKKKNLRVCLTRSEKSQIPWDMKRVFWGCLIQEADDKPEDCSEWKVMTKRKPTSEEETELSFAWTIVKHVKSNAIVFTRSFQTLGIGAGQMSRIDSCKLAIQKWGKPLDGAAMASDAFFPFKDSVEEAARMGVRAIIQPGGSLRDQESIDAADAHGIAMIFTGRRHFRH